MNKLSRRKAFTLIELLIVIAIIGILFIVLVSKVDFATDKAKATGVQTDFRSFQVALETVAKENAGFNTFGWDTGDVNGNRIRDSYDKGDTNQNGIQDDGEVFVGSKVYGEEWTGIYTLVKPGTDFSSVGYDEDVIFALESAINKNLDPKLHITIDAKTGNVIMANGAKDPWHTEYHGYYITNAEVDNKDRGAIIMYSNGANQEWGSEHSISNGVVTVNVPGNNVYGKDDYSLTSCYSLTNNTHNIVTTTTGFSNNIQTMDNNYSQETDNNIVPITNLEPGLYETGSNYKTLVYSWNELVSNGIIVSNQAAASQKSKLAGDLVIPGNVYISTSAFEGCTKLTNVRIAEGVTSLGWYAFMDCTSLQSVEIPASVTGIALYAFDGCTSLESITFAEGSQLKDVNMEAFEKCTKLKNVYFNGTIKTWCNINFHSNYGNPCYYGADLYIQGTKIVDLVIPDDVTTIKDYVFRNCTSLNSVVIGNGVTRIGKYAFYLCKNLKSVEIGNNVININEGAFSNCINMTEVVIGNKVTNIGASAFNDCDSLVNVVIPDSVTNIDRRAFFYCDSLTSVIIGAGVTDIGDAAFYDCGNLTNIVFNGTVEQWRSVNKGSMWNQLVPTKQVTCSDGIS